MKKPVSILALALLALAPLPPVSAAVMLAGAIGAPLAASHVSDLRRIMDANQTLAYVQGRLMAEEGRLPVEQKEVLKAFCQDELAPDLYQQARFLYAGKLPPRLAAELASLMDHPAYRKRALQALRAPGAGSDEASLFSDAEREELQRIDASEAMAAWRVQEPVLQRDLLEMVRWWQGEFGRMVRIRMMDNLRQATQQISAMKEAGTPRDLALAPTGIPAFDAAVKLSVESNLAIKRVDLRFEQQLAVLDIAGLLQAEQLASAEGLAAARQRLAQADVLLDAYLKEVGEALRAREKAMHALVLAQDPRYLEGMNASMGLEYASVMKLGAARRDMHEQHRVALDFFAAHQARYRLQGGQLQFDSTADAEQAKQLVSKARMGQVQLLRTGLDRIKAEAQMKHDLDGTPMPEGM